MDAAYKTHPKYEGKGVPPAGVCKRLTFNTSSLNFENANPEIHDPEPLNPNPQTPTLSFGQDIVFVVTTFLGRRRTALLNKCAMIYPCSEKLPRPKPTLIPRATVIEPKQLSIWEVQDALRPAILKSFGILGGAAGCIHHPYPKQVPPKPYTFNSKPSFPTSTP